MLTGLAVLILAVPFPPVLTAPPSEGWSRGRGGEFVTGGYQDDAGVAASQVKLEFRRDDAGYGGLQETFAFNRYVYPTITFPTEGDRYCWRATHFNSLNESSLPSAEQCFRTDWTPPSSPAFVDAGAITSEGRVDIELLPATDLPSGVHGYFLELAPTPTGDFQGFAYPQTTLPFVAWLGEGTWYGWVRVSDFALNDNRQMLADYTISITVIADSTVPVPEAPRFQRTMANSYGDGLDFDAGWMVADGITHVVASYCYQTAGGCSQWEPGFHSMPVSEVPGNWLQVNGEGVIVARIAVVRAGRVGRWSAPSQKFLVDRTPPPVPPNLMASPALSRGGPITLSWGAVVDNVTGLRHTVLDETEILSGQTRGFAPVAAPVVSLMVTPPHDGVYRYRAVSVDFVENHSTYSNTAELMVDSTGPTSLAPVATASAIDGGALVSLTWALPTDALSGVSSEELEERNGDGGTQPVAVTGLGASRIIGPGTWRWTLRGTDVAGNPGAFSPPSNTIVVSETGVANGPAIVTSTASANCQVPLTQTLQGTGDAPLQWALVSGPPGLAVDAQGQLTWTPSAMGIEPVQVRLTNGAGSVTGIIEVTVTCAASPDAGPDPAKKLSVGCGCSSLEGALLGLAVGLLRRRRPGVMSHV